MAETRCVFDEFILLQKSAQHQLMRRNVVEGGRVRCGVGLFGLLLLLFCYVLVASRGGECMPKSTPCRVGLLLSVPETYHTSPWLVLQGVVAAGD